MILIFFILIVKGVVSVNYRKDTYLFYWNVGHEGIVI